MSRDRTGVNFTCPDIDSAISIMEKVRSENSELRDVANEAIERAEDAEAVADRLEDEKNELQKELDAGCDAPCCRGEG